MIITMIEVATQIETCERASYEQNNDDNIHVKRSDDKATLDHTEESRMSADEGYSEPSQAEQTSGSIVAGTSPNSLSHLSMLERLAAVLRQSERV